MPSKHPSKRPSSPYPNTPKKARTLPNPSLNKKPSKRLRFAENKQTQTDNVGSPLDTPKLSQCTSNETNKSDKKIHPFTKTQLELRILPSPEPGKEFYYTYEYPPFNNLDDDWNSYLQLYDDDADMTIE